MIFMVSIKTSLLLGKSWDFLRLYNLLETKMCPFNSDTYPPLFSVREDTDLRHTATRPGGVGDGEGRPRRTREDGRGEVA